MVAHTHPDLPNRGSGGRGLFVWTKMHAEGGQTLESILAIKEAEREAGNGFFWWGIGNSLGSAAIAAAKTAGGTLPIVFSKMRSSPKKIDTHPTGVCLWNRWEDPEGMEHEIPNHVLEWSRGTPDKKKHYAMVCYSEAPINLGYFPFDPSRCRTHLGNTVASSHVTGLLEGGFESATHTQSAYDVGFSAKLVDPWIAKLVKPRMMSNDERAIHSTWSKESSWDEFVGKFRRPRRLEISR